MELSSYIDSTNLKNIATEKDIKNLCEDAKKYHFASVCVHPIYVELAKELLKDSNVEVNAVIGFPLGMNTKEVKVYEAIDAITNGADGIEMVVNIAMIKNKEYDYVKEEIEEVRDAIDGKTVKVIIEASLLEEEEIIKMTEICKETFVHFIQTSTGFRKEEISKENIETILKHKNEILEIKVAGEIEKEEKMIELIEMGVTKIGSSHATKIMKGEKNDTI